MSGTGRHASSPVLSFPTRLGVTTAVAALVAVAGIIGAVAVNSPGPRPVSAARPAPAAATRPGASINRVPGSTVAIAKANAVPALSGLRHRPDGAPSVAAPARRATMPLVLTDVDHQDCPAAAAACVDLTRHITWLQANGKVTFGPVRMEPGKPGGQHQTPRGTFQVAVEGRPVAT